jgi:hypothetical protein
MLYKVERTTRQGWYEVMLSPFQTRENIEQYLSRYAYCYPKEDRKYKITDLTTNEQFVRVVD